MLCNLICFRNDSKCCKCTVQLSECTAMSSTYGSVNSFIGFKTRLTALTNVRPELIIPNGTLVNSYNPLFVQKAVFHWSDSFTGHVQYALRQSKTEITFDCPTLFKTSLTIGIG